MPTNLKHPPARISKILNEPFPSLDKVLIEELNGSQGNNREKYHRCQINAANDWDAIQIWLSAYQSSASTVRLYRMEAERFLLWCVLHLKKAMSSINQEDIENYAAFLLDPQPRNYWCAPRAGGGKFRGDPGWRPFTGPLSASSCATALSVLQSLFSYLTAARYLSFNPFMLIKRRTRGMDNAATRFIQQQHRAIGQEEWVAILSVLTSYPDQNPKEIFHKKRLRFIVVMLYFLGLRVEELATHTWEAFQLDKEGLWWFYLIGKGNKPRLIPVADDLLREIIQYRNFLNKPTYPSARECEPIITDFTKIRPTTARHIHYVFKMLVRHTAATFVNEPEKAARVAKFSPHWIRHLTATMQDEVGIKEGYIQDNLGHTDSRTTQRYIHRVNRSRHDANQKLKLINLKGIR
jgi:integrase